MIDQSPGADRDGCRSWPHMASIALRNNFHPDQHLRRQRKLIVAADVSQNEQKRPENPAKVSEAKKSKGGFGGTQIAFPGDFKGFAIAKLSERVPFSIENDPKRPHCGRVRQGDDGVLPHH